MHVIYENDNYVRGLLGYMFSESRYDYLINGEALEATQSFISEQHTFAEYTEVSLLSINLFINPPAGSWLFADYAACL
jgi:hypothetical protein